MTEGEFKQQYKALIKKYHPDLCGDDTKKEIYEEITAR